MTLNRYYAVIYATLLFLAVSSFRIAACAPLPANDRFILGVLEDDTEDFVDGTYFRDVRVLFEKTGGIWRALPSDCRDRACLSASGANYPTELTWTIAFDGKRLGTVTAQTPQKLDSQSQAGRQKITSDGPVPTVGKRSLEFAGWIHEPRYRPLIANSQPYYQDPASWKRSELSSVDISQIKAAFRHKFPNVTNCRNAHDDIGSPWKYPDSAIRVEKSYTSNAGWSIATATLTGFLCDAIPDEPFQPQTFIVSPKKTASFLDQGILLVDAGDYDNDGKSELLFAIDRYNEGGYELFYDDFKQRAKFSYTYH